MGSSNIRVSTPIIITGEIQHDVLSKFRSIDANDDKYLNKTIKSRDELAAFNYNETDSIQLDRGDPEEIQDTFGKERTAKLEYQDDALYERSTTHDFDVLSISPHTNMQTKLLELRPFDREDLFAKMYIRFVTESILYNVAMGYAEDVIKFEYGEINAYLSVKDLLVLFFYCEFQLHGYFTHTTDKGTQKRDVLIPKYAALTVPYKKQFNELSHWYNWRNIERYSPYVLNIIPDELTLESGSYRKRVYNERTGEYEWTYPNTLPEDSNGVYRLSNPDDSSDKWKWVSENGSTITYDNMDGGVGRWVFKFVSGFGETSSELVTYSSVQIPYWNWLCWHPDLVLTDSDGIDMSANDAHIRVTGFHYAIDDMMPNYSTDTYADFDNTQYSLVHLIDKQASGFVDMWKEYIFSGLSRQHSCFLEIIDDRTFKGNVELNLSPYETFREHIENSEEFRNILSGLDYISDELKTKEYKYIADTVIKLLYPIESEYLIDASLQMSGKLDKIKDLLVDLCSYNVAWVVDPNAFGNSIVDCFGNNTLDVVEFPYGMLDVSRITETETNFIYRMGLIDRWCYDEIYTKKYLADPSERHYVTIVPCHFFLNTETNEIRMVREDEAAHEESYVPIKIIDEPTCHDCIDHQYIITSRIEEHIPTIIVGIEGDIERKDLTSYPIGHGIKTILNLADSDYPHPLIYRTSGSEMMDDITEFIEKINDKRSEYSESPTYNDIVKEYGEGKVRLLLSKLYHLKFRDSTFASLMKNYKVGSNPDELETNSEYDASYNYVNVEYIVKDPDNPDTFIQKESVKTITKLHTINK